LKELLEAEVQLEILPRELGRSSPRGNQWNDVASLERQIRVEFGLDAIEVGAIRFETKDGRSLVATFTSRNHGRLSHEAMVKAFNGICAQNQLQLGDIRRVDFLHTHPGNHMGAFILSRGDESTALTLRHFLDANGGRHIEHSIYAIAANSEGKVFLAEMTPPHESENVGRRIEPVSE
jgi:hypothetical protein